MAEPQNTLAPENKNFLKSLAEHPNPVQYLMQLASERPEYAALQNYLTSRSAMPPVSFGYLSDGSTGQFAQKGFFGNSNIPNTGQVTLTQDFLKRGYDPTNPIPTLTHELTHAAQKELISQSMQKDVIDQQAKQQFLDAYSKIVYDQNKRGRNAFGPNALAYKLNPAWTESQEGYRASSGELPAWAMGNVANTNPLVNYDDYKAPSHLNSTLATEYQILLDLATRDAKANPNKKAR
jgi:hypothetical protein